VIVYYFYYEEKTMNNFLNALIIAFVVFGGSIFHKFLKKKDRQIQLFYLYGVTGFFIAFAIIWIMLLIFPSH